MCFLCVSCRVTSQFIVDGVLDGLSMLTRLNLSRTAVCDIGTCTINIHVVQHISEPYTLPTIYMYVYMKCIS